MEIKEYRSENLEEFKRLFAELQTFEKSVYPGRAEPTPEFMEKLTQSLIDDVNKQQGKIYLAYVEEKAAGFVAGYVEEDVENDNTYFRIDSLVTSEKFRNKGVAKSLMDRVEEYAKSMGQTKIGMGVLSGNKKAYKYYRKLGFDDYGIEMIKSI
jgi:ribosomal protein S18 acetylase RimI-like enzyme